MKNLKMKALEFAAKTLTRNEMKNVLGGWGPIHPLPPCGCCPTTPCRPSGLVCPAVVCPQ